MSTVKLRTFLVQDPVGHPMYEVPASSPEAACAIVYERILRRKLTERSTVTEVVDEMRPYDNITAVEIDR